MPVLKKRGRKPGVAVVKKGKKETEEEKTVVKKGKENAVDAVKKGKENAVDAVKKGKENAVDVVVKKGKENAVDVVKKGKENAVDVVKKGKENAVAVGKKGKKETVAVVKKGKKATVAVGEKAKEEAAAVEKKAKEEAAAVEKKGKDETVVKKGKEETVIETNKEQVNTKSATQRRSEAFRKIRMQNIAQRNQILSDMGLANSKDEVNKVVRQVRLVRRNIELSAEEKEAKAEKRRKSLAQRQERLANASPPSPSSKRRSVRIENRPAINFGDLEDDDEAPSNKRRRDADYDHNGDHDDDADYDHYIDYDDDKVYETKPGCIDKSRYKYKKPMERVRPQVFGAIPGVPVGETFESREESNWAGIHRPTVAGISGSDTEGAYSICMSGGYEDDVDYGECFTFTGSGGRDLKGTKAKPKNLRTAPQSKDQQLVGLNMAMAVSYDKKQPVRVMRGYKLNSPYAPSRGYRYDGLYTVEKYYEQTGLSGFKVFVFIFKRMADQSPPPWEVTIKGSNEDDDDVEDDSNTNEDES